MKKYIKIAILTTISCLLIYLAGAFINLTFDFTLWTSEFRFIIAILMFIISFFLLLIFYETPKKSEITKTKSYSTSNENDLCIRCGKRKKYLDMPYCNTCDDLRMGLT